MNAHLTGAGISRWLLGERTAAEEEHVRDCPACAREIERMGGALARFRGAVHGWAAAPPARAHHPLRWAWAALVAAAMLWPIYAGLAKRRQAERARADEILLEQVDAGVSRAIARPMEPLAKLMTWEENRKREGVQ